LVVMCYTFKAERYHPLPPHLQPNTNMID
jgi:hypothetical protein